ncbi:MAG TPA: transcriptional regulator [Alphaproteobacteria bacterium]|nr:transcriptional regulator [Alphaproteobacteria bacterium]
MGPTLGNVMAKLPKARRAKIEKRAAEFVRREMTLRELRKARALTQEKLAETLKTSQNQVSKLEQRSDLLLSTLSSYVSALGGKLHLVAEFPGQKPVQISGITEIG